MPASEPIYACNATALKSGEPQGRRRFRAKAVIWASKKRTNLDGVVSKRAETVAIKISASASAEWKQETYSFKFSASEIAITIVKREEFVIRKAEVARVGHRTEVVPSVGTIKR